MPTIQDLFDSLVRQQPWDAFLPGPAATVQGSAGPHAAVLEVTAEELSPAVSCQPRAPSVQATVDTTCIRAHYGQTQNSKWGLDYGLGIRPLGSDYDRSSC